MRRRLLFLLALVSCLTITNAFAVDQVLTVYFMGTNMNSSMWNPSNNDKFPHPETTASLWYFDTAFDLSGPETPPAGTTRFKGHVDGPIIDPRWDERRNAALGYLDEVPDCGTRCITLNIVGFSRGGVSAIDLASHLRYDSRWSRLKKVNVLAFDPVPGDEGGFDHIDGDSFNVPDGIDYFGFYAVDERTEHFAPSFPAHDDSSNQWFKFFEVRGAHETLVGNTYKDGKDGTHGDGCDQCNPRPGCDDPRGLGPVSNTLRRVATEMLGSSDWGHVRFRAPEPWEAALGALNLNWYGGETSVDRLRQAFVSELELIYAYAGWCYEWMRENGSGALWLEAWWYQWSKWQCNTATEGWAREYPRCVYYYPGGYPNENLGEGNAGFDDVVAAQPLNTMSDGTYVIWDLILQHGSLDVDGDLIDYDDDDCPNDRLNDVDADGVCGDLDNCPTVPNPYQADLDRDGAGDACDGCPRDPADDQDGDGICEGPESNPPMIGHNDNCPIVANADQADTDLDGTGDACECLGVDCNDWNQCTADSCVAATGGCVHANISDGTPCSDGSVCTLNDVCGSGSCLAGGATGTFSAAAGPPVGVGPTPYAVAVGDFNRDGKPDLVTANSGDNTVTILLGSGSGGFDESPGSPVAVGSLPMSVAVGDFDRDGSPDLVTANSWGNNVTILLGSGSGGFTEAAGSPFAVGWSPSSVAVGDFNRDGKPDLVTANSDTVTILLGNGSGGFTEAEGSPIWVGWSPSSVAVGDFNRDENLDLVTTNSLSDSVRILLGNGWGGFTEATGSFIWPSRSPSSVAVGDFNRDGKPDLVTANADSNDVTILRGDGWGGFSQFPGSPVAVGLHPQSVAVGDVNLDGNLDLVTANLGSVGLTILLGNGSGGFTEAEGSPVTLQSGPYSVAVGDFNLDHRPDLVTANPGSNYVTILLGNRGVLDCDDQNDCNWDGCNAEFGCEHRPLLPNGTTCDDRNPCTTNDVCFGARCLGGSGGFAEPPVPPVAVGSLPESVAVSDFNHDGSLDLVTANSGDYTLTILLGNGSGGFIEAAGSPVWLFESPSSVAVGDFNLDGTSDLVAAQNSEYDDYVTILLGNGLGGFTEAEGSPYAVGSSPSSVAVGDFNFYADQLADLVTANAGSNNVTILLGNGSGGFTEAAGSPIRVGRRPTSVAVGEFNLDHQPDLVTANFDDNTVTVLQGIGSGGFTGWPGSPFAVGSHPRSVAVGEFNAGQLLLLDLVTANDGSNNVTILLGNGGGPFTPSPGSPVAVGSSPYSIAAGFVDFDGNLDVVTANAGSSNVTILLGNGSGGFTESADSPLAVGSYPHSVAVGDFNGDGRPDIVTANSGSSNVTILLREASLLDCDDLDPCTADSCAPASGCVHDPLADADADGVCDAVDCDDANPHCAADPCTDADADGFCVTTDCDDANPYCTGDCTDADADRCCAAFDCDEANPGCTTDCTDGDSDRYCNPNDSCPSVSNPLQRDSDADRVGDACDCAPQDAGIATPLGPARNLRFVSPTDMAWDPPAVGDGLTYDLVRSGDASNWQSVTCLAMQTTDTAAADAATPAPGAAFFYLVRAKRSCGENLGTDSAEQRRQAAACTPPRKRVFVTSSTYTGDLGGLAGADEKCQQRAVAAGFPGTFRAWLSDSATSASARLTPSTLPYVRVDGVQVADNWTDLTDGALDAAIVVDENGVNIQMNDSQVWTATDTVGSPSAYFCSDWTTGSAIPWGDVGHAHASDFTWTQAYAMVCSEPNRLYCFEQ